MNSSMCILLADDDDSFVKSIVPLLSRHGDVEVARTIRCALRVVAERAHLRAVIVDLCLPGRGSGFDVIAEVRRARLGTPMALLGRHLEPPAANAAYLAGADYLEKPINCACIERFMNVRLPLSEKIQLRSQTWQERHRLSGAQTDILCRAAMGENRDTIAACRSSSTLTVKRQIADLLRKTGDESLHAAIERLVREVVDI
jgi:DNA-binding NarL/FixJ family response regulator